MTRATSARWGWWLAALFLAGAGLAIWPGEPVAAVASPAVPMVSISPTQPGVVRYYVVGDPVNGQGEFLFDIAVKTLGNGNRYMEIFKLNEGRLQPDGLHVSDPAAVSPGWVLLLPADASGPGVQVGVLPVFTQRPATAPANRADDSVGENGLSDRAVRLTAFAVLILVLGLAISLLRRGKRIGVAGWPSPAGIPALPSAADEPVIRLHASPADDQQRVHLRAARPTTSENITAWWPSNPSPAVAPYLADVPLAADVLLVAGAPLAGAPYLTDVSLVAGTPSTMDVVPLDDDIAPEEPAEGHNEAAHNEVAPWRPRQRLSAAPRPSRSQQPLVEATESDVPMLETNVMSGADKLAVRLVGVRGPAGTPFAWFGSVHARPPAASAVRFGHSDRGALLVDLALSPDVIRISGTASGVRRSTRSIVSQLEAAGIPVTFVGDVPGAPEHARSVPSFGDVLSQTPGALNPPPGAPLRVVVAGPPQSHEVALMHRMVGQHQPRTVIVVVGDGPLARWSLDVTSTDNES